MSSMTKVIKKAMEESLKDVLKTFKDGELKGLSAEIKDMIVELAELKIRLCSCEDQEEKAGILADIKHVESSLSSLEAISKVAALRICKEMIVKFGYTLIKSAKTL